MKNTQSNIKLTVITRRDLTPGAQAVQSAHAAIDFQHQHPEISKQWHTDSNYLVFLAAEDESDLSKYLQKLSKNGIKCTTFKEPDMKNELTAIAVEPSKHVRKICGHLPLALK